MKLQELKSSFEEIRKIFKKTRFEKPDFIEKCTEIFKKGADLYDRLPEIEQLLASLHVKTSEEFEENLKVYITICMIGRVSEEQRNNVEQFYVINLAKEGEETTSETIRYASMKISEIGDEPGAKLWRKRVKDTLSEQLENLKDICERLQNLDSMQE